MNPTKTSFSPTSSTKNTVITKPKMPTERKRLLFHRSAQGRSTKVTSNLSRLLEDGPNVVEEVLPKRKHVVPKLKLMKLKFYKKSASENTILKSQWKTNTRKENGRLMIILSNCGMTPTTLHLAEPGALVFDLPNMCTDLDVRHFDDSHKQGRDTVYSYPRCNYVWQQSKSGNCPSCWPT